MAPGLEWVIVEKGRLALARTPRTKEELRELLEAPKDLVVSMLTPEDDPGAAGSIEELHAQLARTSGKVILLPTGSGAPPSPEQALLVLEEIRRVMERGGRVVIICGRAWGRSACLAASYLVYRGRSPEEALRLIEEEARRRGEEPPSPEQKKLPFAVRELRRASAGT